MTDDDKRHMDAARRLARHAAEREWLKAAYETLDRQRTVLGALDQALGVYYPPGDPTKNTVLQLKLKVGRVMVATIDSIMRHSGLTDLDRSDWGDQAASPSGEAREETVPW